MSPKHYLETAPPPATLSKGLDDRPPHPPTTLSQGLDPALITVFIRLTALGAY